MGHAFDFGTDLPHQIGGREMGHQQGGDEYRTDDRFRTIQGEIPGSADEGQQSGDDTLERKLQQLDRADAGGANTESDQFCPNWDPAVAEQGVAESHFHRIATCILFQERTSCGVLRRA